MSMIRKSCNTRRAGAAGGRVEKKEEDMCRKRGWCVRKVRGGSSWREEELGGIGVDAKYVLMR